MTEPSITYPRRLAGVLPLVLLLVLSDTALAQERTSFLPGSSLTISGDSNHSEWTVTADSLYGWVEYSVDGDGNPVVSAVQLHVLSREIKSNRSPIMDRLMYKTLKSPPNAEIVFELTGAGMQAGSESGSFTIEAMGDLTIAGVTRRVTVNLEGAAVEGGGYRFTGEHAMKMTDFGMKPPTAMFGALHTRDDCTVHFDLIVGSE